MGLVKKLALLAQVLEELQVLCARTKYLSVPFSLKRQHKLAKSSVCHFRLKAVLQSPSQNVEKELIFGGKCYLNAINLSLFLV